VTRFAVALAVLVGLVGSGAPVQRSPSQADPPFPLSAERAYGALAARVDPADAQDIVSFMEPYWRLAANPGFNASLDHLHAGLTTAGFNGTTASRATSRIEEFATTKPGWDYRTGTVAFADAPGESPLLSRERDRVSLAIGSFPTDREGLHAPLVDVGKGAESDYAGKAIRGAVVLTDAPLGRGWQEAVKKRGAAGVISTEIASYIRPAGPEPPEGDLQDVLQWGGIPYDPAARSFGFKASWKAADRMRRRLAQGPVTVRVDIDSTFYDGPNRTLVAEIPGRSHPEERIVVVAHVQEPGANDNASGCGSLYALARGLQRAIASGALLPPERTLTFIWAEEIGGSRQWIRMHPEDAARVQYMMALDMTGEDTSRTGGTFLIEKQADPSAVWPRPSDPHTAWGASKVAADALKGSLLNDLHLAMCQRRARDTGWIVRTNPYEGGSDHTVFAEAGVPSLLNWHFTDRYYHTNQDRLDKVSASEMQNVAIAVGASVWFLGAADPQDASAVAALVADAASRRLTLERAQGRELAGKAQDKAAAAVIQQQVLAAWIKWYGEALDSVLRLPPAGSTEALRVKVAEAKARVQ
jgi:aminopeptidase YwaD